MGTPPGARDSLSPQPGNLSIGSGEGSLIPTPNRIGLEKGGALLYYD